MTKQDADELGRRALACKHWRWMDGMTVHGLPTYRVVSNNCDGHTYRTDGYDSDSLRDCVPDLSDPATLGCLLHLVRQAQPDQGRWVMSSCCSAYGRWYTNPSRGGGRDYDTEAEALVAALEAAP